ncbi:MAG: hypothetical protein A2X11_12320 [Bacteroidetes bacterium GWE2_42_24]|nr:MAG: hypothetical protein A2X11_12320 [Bacteroidetes bacterium GWE2_42_24]OFY30640.1 MAG: hypothetical protein A2X09_03565 [Bacteroidetes bacterium GWF2_43_11]
MKVVILAAGMARRLQPLTNSTPKCLLPVGDKTLIDRALISIKAAGLSHVVIVTGFEADQIKKHCQSHYSDINFEWIHNERFEETNNIYSLWLTKETMSGHSLLLLDSDIIFHHQILTNLLESNFENCLALRESDKLGDEEIKVTVDEEGFVKAISKVVDPKQAIGESLGIELFGIGLTYKLFRCVNELIVKQGRDNDFYEVAFEKIIFEGGQIKPVSVGSLPCMEIDTASDLQAAFPLSIQLDHE